MKVSFISYLPKYGILSREQLVTLGTTPGSKGQCDPNYLLNKHKQLMILIEGNWGLKDSTLTIFSFTLLINGPGGLMVRHLTPDQNIPGSSPGWVNL